MANVDLDGELTRVVRTVREWSTARDARTAECRATQDGLLAMVGKDAGFRTEADLRFWITQLRTETTHLRTQLEATDHLIVDLVEILVGVARSVEAVPGAAPDPGGR